MSKRIDLPQKREEIMLIKTVVIGCLLTTLLLSLTPETLADAVTDGDAGFFNAFSPGNFFPSGVSNMFNWFFTPEPWTESENSMKNDMYIANNIQDDFGSPTGSTDAVPLNEQAPAWNTLNGAFNFLEGGRNVVDQFGGITWFSTLYDTVIQLGQCATTAEFADPDLGPFPFNASQYCNPKCRMYSNESFRYQKLIVFLFQIQKDSFLDSCVVILKLLIY